MTMKSVRALALGALVAASSLGFTAEAPAQDTIKVGILHSLSGTMAISETTLKDVMLMLIEEQNKKGGLLGKKLEAVVVDPASNWPLFAEKARELITRGYGLQGGPICEQRRELLAPGAVPVMAPAP